MNVLVVDDHRDTNEMLCRMLQRQGHRTSSAYSSETALESIGTGPPDVVILDNMMPGMNGIDALRAIRSTPGSSGLPVIMYTAMADRAFEAHVLEIGANAYFVKGAMKLNDLLDLVGKFAAA